jgi:LPXTG-motif cell wall-anchored protein
VQLTSPSRRVFGILAASTIGLSTALVGIAGVAQAAPVGPEAPTIDAIEGADEALLVFLLAGQDGAYPDAERWEYSLDGGTTFDDATDAGFTNGYDAVFEIGGLINGDEYEVVIRGVDEGLDPDDASDDEPGDWSDPEVGTPYALIGAPGTPTVTAGNGVLNISWTAPTEQGTFALGGYKVYAYVTAPDGGGQTGLCETDAATLSCTAKVIPGWKYSVLVTPVDAEGNWGFDSEASALITAPAMTVPAAVPTKSADLTMPAGASSSVAAGKTITVTGTGYAPGSTVTLAIYSTPTVLTTVVADANGAFTVTVTVPAGLAAGKHTLVAAGVDDLGNARYVNLEVTVTSGGGVRLANTGADVTVPALGGIAVLGLGAGLIVAARRRSNA